MTTRIASRFTAKNTFIAYGLAALTLTGCNLETGDTAMPQPESTHQAHHLGVKATLYFHTSIENKWVYQQLYELAEQKLLANFTAQTWETQPAVILDIDETVLDNSRYEIENIALGRTYTLETWKEWTARAAAPALPGALAFCQLADSLGVKVIYLSNREVDETDATQQNLEQLGFPQAANLLLKSDSSDKTVRRASVQENHPVILYLGDNFRDFSEDFSKRNQQFGADVLEALADSMRTYFVLFPNPMYGEWEKPVAPALDSPDRIVDFLDN